MFLQYFIQYTYRNSSIVIFGPGLNGETFNFIAQYSLATPFSFTIESFSEYLTKKDEYFIISSVRPQFFYSIYEINAI